MGLSRRQPGARHTSVLSHTHRAFKEPSVQPHTLSPSLFTSSRLSQALFSSAARPGDTTPRPLPFPPPFRKKNKSHTGAFRKLAASDRRQLSRPLKLPSPKNSKKKNILQNVARRSQALRWASLIHPASLLRARRWEDTAAAAGGRGQVGWLALLGSTRGLL